MEPSRQASARQGETAGETRFLPPVESRRIAEIYAFCRFTDDLVEDLIRTAEERYRRIHAGLRGPVFSLAEKRLGGLLAMAALYAVLAGAASPVCAAATESGALAREAVSRKEPSAVPEPADVYSKGLEELGRAEAAISRRPDSLEPHLDRLRVLFVLGVKDKDYLGKADGEIGFLRGKSGADPHWQRLLMAYQGAVQVVRAKHGLNPNRKMRFLKAGLPLLDSAVAAAPHQPEIRYLRLVSAYYLPFFLGRKPIAKEDFKALAGLLPAAKDAYPPRWFLSVARFVAEKGDLEDGQRRALEASMREVAEAAELAARDGKGGEP